MNMSMENILMNDQDDYLGYVDESLKVCGVRVKDRKRH